MAAEERAEFVPRVGSGSAAKGTRGAAGGEGVLDGALEAHGVATGVAGAAIVGSFRGTADRLGLVRLVADSANVGVRVDVFVVVVVDAHG